MALGFKLNLKMEQRLVMTPMLQQAIKLLPLARLELIQKVRQELVENPMLEELISEDNPDEGPEEGVVALNGDEAVDTKEKVEEQPEIDWESFIQNNIDRGLSSDGLTARPSIEATIKSEITLGDHLLWQLMVSSVNKNEKIIGTAIIGNINNCGYLESPVEEIAQFLETNVEEVEGVLKLVQTFDPLGVSARNLQECLLIQAKALAPDYKLVEILLKNHITRLEERFIQKLAKELKIPVPDIKDAIQFIKTLNPKPASKYSNEQSQYIIPDVTVVKEADEYQVTLNDDGSPRLRVSPFYQNILKKHGSSNNIKEYLEDKYRSAVWLIKSIEQRRQTILKVAKSIVKFQKPFLDNGLSHLKPLVLRDVAENIEMHESTVSRVTTLKYMHTPRGIFDFKFFFHSGIESYNGAPMSSLVVKNKIKDLVNNENSNKPMTDQQIVQSLISSNIKIARRTVTKYRKELKIQAANRRRIIDY